MYNIRGYFLSKIVIFFENITDREKKILILGIYLFVLILGYYLIDFGLKKVKTLEEKLETEKKKYIELNKLVLEYKSKKEVSKSNNLSLSDIDNLSKETNTKNNIVSIKPLSENQIEIILEKVNPADFLQFLQKIKQKKYRITFIKVEKLKGKINSRLVIEE
ncbi:MAG TPA: hypothetical protein EYH43_02105 [Persephonella sp.]|nr:hypothetical protein [Hydrogenothermaceae bacterium]HIQ24761.1 hypothetical protein [Persephonella sp.]